MRALLALEIGRAISPHIKFMRARFVQKPSASAIDGTKENNKKITHISTHICIHKNAPFFIDCRQRARRSRSSTNSLMREVTT